MITFTETISIFLVHILDGSLILISFIRYILIFMMYDHFEITDIHNNIDLTKNIFIFYEPRLILTFLFELD